MDCIHLQSLMATQYTKYTMVSRYYFRVN